MKRIAMFFLSCIMILSVTACGARPASTGDVEQPASEEPQTQSQGTTQSPDTTEASGKSEIAKVTIDETVLYEQNQLKITAKEMYYDSYWENVCIKVLIENNSDKDWGIQCDSTVNNYTQTNYFSCFVAAGKKANETIELYMDELAACGIDTISEIALSFIVEDADSYNTLFETGDIELRTSAYGTIEQPDIEGQTLYDKDGILIVGNYAENYSYGDGALLVFVKNCYGKDIEVSCENVSINGFMIDAYFYQEVKNGRRTVACMSIYSDELEKNDIESFDEIELVLEIEDSKTYREIDKTKPIVVSTGSQNPGGTL